MPQQPPEYSHASHFSPDLCDARRVSTGIEITFGIISPNTSSDSSFSASDQITIILSEPAAIQLLSLIRSHPDA